RTASRRQWRRSTVARHAGTSGRCACRKRQIGETTQIDALNYALNHLEKAQKGANSWNYWKCATAMKSSVCDNSDGSRSFWHAIMHRREPDAWNSKYWWRRVGKHPVFAQLGDQAARLGWPAWDPAAFVDACEKERGTGSDREKLLRELQR